MGFNQHIWLAMHQTRPILADAMRILKGIANPAGAKFDGSKDHRRAKTPDGGIGIVPIMGPNGPSYANPVGAFGVVSAVGNWDRLSRAVHRWAIALVKNKDIYISFILGWRFSSGRK